MTDELNTSQDVAIPVRTDGRVETSALGFLSVAREDINFKKSYDEAMFRSVLPALSP